MILILCHCTRLCYNQESKYSEIFPYMYDTFNRLLLVHQYISDEHSKGTFSIYIYIRFSSSAFDETISICNPTAFLWWSVRYNRGKALTSLDRLKYSSPDNWIARPRCYTGYCLRSSPPGQKGRNLGRRHFQLHFLELKWYNSDQIPVKYVPGSPIDNKPALIQVIAWHRTVDKPLPGPMMTQFIDAYMRH